MLAALCTGGAPPARGGRLVLPSTLASGAPPAVVGVAPRCGAAAGSAVWGLLLEGKLGGARVRGGLEVRCGRQHAVRVSALTAALATNAAAGAAADEVTTIASPVRQLAAALTAPLLADAASANLPRVIRCATTLAAAVAAGNTTALRRELLSPAGAALPGVLTSFNVVVSPLGALQSLATVLARGAAAAAPPPRRAHGAPRPPCGEFVASLFEAEPAAQAAAKAAGVAAADAAALGGPAAEARLRRRAPRLWLTPYWPAYGGAALADEVPVAGGSALLAGPAVAIPRGDEVPEPHGACSSWDETGDEASGDPRVARALTVVDEVVVLTPPADSYYWLTVDVVGRLQLLLPYLRARPHVRLHLPWYFVAAWGPAHHATAWLDGLGLSGRVVTGRVVARVAHLLDALPVGPRARHAELLGARDAGLAVAGASGALGGARGGVLLVQRASTRRVANLARLATAVAGAIDGWPVLVFDPPAGGVHALAGAIAAWAGADAVVAPHGGGLANAIFMAPGATLIELPMGYAAVGLYYLHVAHAARVRHSVLLVPGGLATPLTHDVDSVVSILVDAAVAARGSAARRAGLPSAAIPTRPPPPPPWPRSPGATAEHRPRRRLAAAEPISALAPYGSAVVASAVGCAPDEPDVPRRLWVSTALPLSAATGGVALLLPAADAGPSLYALLPSQRGLLRALEAAGILPVALPTAMCCARADRGTSRCHYNYSDVCGNPDVAAAVALTGPLLAAVAAAAGRDPGGPPPPLFAVGLSSGAVFAGVLAGEVRIDAIVAQLEPPSSGMLARRGGGGGGGSDGRRVCSLPLTLGLRPPTADAPPALWLTAAAGSPIESAAVSTFADAWTAAGGPPPVVDTWVASGVLARGAVAARAPWLLSVAAGAVVEDALVAAGALVGDGGGDGGGGGGSEGDEVLRRASGDSLAAADAALASVLLALAAPTTSGAGGRGDRLCLFALGSGGRGAAASAGADSAPGDREWPGASGRPHDGAVWLQPASSPAGDVAGLLGLPCAFTRTAEAPPAAAVAGDSPRPVIATNASALAARTRDCRSMRLAMAAVVLHVRLVLSELAGTAAYVVSITIDGVRPTPADVRRREDAEGEDFSDRDRRRFNYRRAWSSGDDDVVAAADGVNWNSAEFRTFVWDNADGRGDDFFNLIDTRDLNNEFDPTR